MPRCGPTAAEIEQAIWNADRMARHRERDRVLFRAKTDAGRRLVVVAQIVREGVRPITAWEEERWARRRGQRPRQSWRSSTTRHGTFRVSRVAVRSRSRFGGT